jgi:hypothetical protein
MPMGWGMTWPGGSFHLIAGPFASSGELSRLGTLVSVVPCIDPNQGSSLALGVTMAMVEGIRCTIAIGMHPRLSTEVVGVDLKAAMHEATTCEEGRARAPSGT